MVKFGKKFFFDETNNTSMYQNTKKTLKKNAKKANKQKKSNKHTFKEKISNIFLNIIYIVKKFLPLIIILLLIVLFAICIKSCSKDEAKTKKNDQTKKIVDKEKLNVVDQLVIEINETLPTVDKLVENVHKFNIDEIVINYDEKNLVDNKYTEPGEYKATIKFDKKTYETNIIVLDTKAPELILKDYTINEGETYSINNFIQSCTDNSLKECQYRYVDTKFGNLTAAGTYDIKLIAIDNSNNPSEEKTAKLTIKAKPQTNQQQVQPKPEVQPKPTNTCKFGDSSYDSKTTLIDNVTKNNCALDPNLAKTADYIAKSENMTNKDVEKLANELQKKNLDMKLELSKDIRPIFNNTNNGFVGYASCITVTDVTKSRHIILKYYINSQGNRVYLVNELGL